MNDNSHHILAKLEWPLRGTSSRTFLLPVRKLRLRERNWVGLGHTVMAEPGWHLTSAFFCTWTLLIANVVQYEDGMSYTCDCVGGRWEGNMQGWKMWCLTKTSAASPRSDRRSHISYLRGVKDKCYLEKITLGVGWELGMKEREDGSSSVSSRRHWRAYSEPHAIPLLHKWLWQSVWGGQELGVQVTSYLGYHIFPCLTLVKTLSVVRIR